MKVSEAKRAVLQSIAERVRPLLDDDDWCELDEKDSVVIIWHDLLGTIFYEDEGHDEVLIYVSHLEYMFPGWAWQRVFEIDQVPDKTMALLRGYESDLLPEGAVFLNQDPNVRSYRRRQE
jgi:hypothetical protein